MDLKLYTSKEVANLFGCSVQYLNKLVEYGFIRCINIGHGQKFLSEEIYSFETKYNGYDISSIRKIKEVTRSMSDKEL